MNSHPSTLLSGDESPNFLAMLAQGAPRLRGMSGYPDGLEWESGVLDAIRTRDFRIRNPVLYPSELREPMRAYYSEASPLLHTSNANS